MLTAASPALRPAAALVLALLLLANPAHAAAPPPAPPTSVPLWATIPIVPKLPAPSMAGIVPNDGARIYFAVFGNQGPPVILLHGGFASSASWGFEIPRLATTHRVIVLDSRGHGRSTMPDLPLHYDDMASDTLAVLDTLRIRRAAIVGLSDGAITGLLLALHHPDRVDRLFAWGASYDTHADAPDPASPDPAMAGMGKVFMARMQQQYAAVSPTPDGFPRLRQALAALYASEPNLTLAELARIHVPVTIADGAHEQFIAPATTAAMAHAIPGAKLLIMPDVSHGGPQQSPDAFHAALLTWLQ